MALRADNTNSYRETARRYRRLLCLPPLLAMVIAGAVALSAGKSYKSSASILVDNPAPLGSSLSASSSTASTNPSSQEDTLLDELLSTQSFGVAVADNSKLESYLKQHGASGPLSQAEIQTLQNGVTSSTPGPQLLQVTYEGPTPQVAQSVVTALITQLRKSSSLYGATYGASEVSYYRAQATAAQSALTAARAKATAYLKLHPSATANNDPTYAVLLGAVQSANAQLTAADASISQAQSAVSTGANAPVMTVEDPASFPTGPTTGKRKVVEAAIGGLVGGLLVSLLVIVLLTPAKPDELDEQLSLRAVEGQAGSRLPARRGPSTESTSSMPLELRLSESEGRSTSLPRLPKSGS